MRAIGFLCLVALLGGPEQTSEWVRDDGLLDIGV